MSSSLSPPPLTPLAIQLFGPLRVLVHGEPLPRLRTRSVEWLLALLILRHGRAVERSWLAGTLWPESGESRALGNLREDLVRLRKALGGEQERLHSPSRDALTLDLTGAEVDVLRFDAAIQAGSQAGSEGAQRSAVALYSGPLLEGCDEAWVLAERESREQACLAALERLAETAQQRGDLADALTLLRRAEGMDPLSDSIQRQKMHALAASGDTPAALLAYREYRLRLHREMNAEPDPETTRLFQQIRTAGKAGKGAGERTGDGESRKPEPPPPPRPDAASPPPPAALPHPITALIGREEAVEELGRLVAAARLVTLVGTGGVGKTRLAIQVATEVAAEAADDFPNTFPDGAVFVALAPLSDPALLPVFLAAALGIREEGRDAAELLFASLVGWLRAHPCLLVLDNCEHLIEAIAQLVQPLLERCPDLHLLATSRQRLGLTGETVWRVPSLPSPDPEELERLPADEARLLEEVMHSPAVQLFCERASLVKTGFRLTGRADALAVATICASLDGIPLAIELAAARTGVLTLPQIVSRLSDRFRLLTGGSRGVLTRHQTLRALIDWSYDLLTKDEQALLRRLSVFVGGWTLEAAEAVDGNLDTLASLADKSLVLAEEHTGGLRYRLLETVREYALEKLRERGAEEAGARNQHLACFLSLAQEIGPALRGSNLESALGRVEPEIGNVRAALAWAQTDAAAPQAHVQLTAALWPYWQYQGLSEGRAYLRAARGRSEGRETPERAQIVLGQSRLAYLLHELDEALARGQESLALLRRLGDRRDVAEALLYTGMAARERQEHESLADSIALLTEGLEESRRCGWARGSALALLQLGMGTIETDTPRARALLEESLSLAEASGDPLLTAQALQKLGQLELVQGDFDRVGDRLERALAIHRRLRDWHEVGLTLRWLGLQARKQGNLTQSLARLQEAAAISREQGNPVYMAANLYECGCVLYEQGAYAQARAAFTEALDLFRQPGGDFGVAFCGNQLGSTLYHLGEYAQSRELHREALALYQKAQNAEGTAWTLERLAAVEAAGGDARTAARLLGAASVVREGLGKPLDRWDQADWDQAVAAVRATLGEAAFDTGYTLGRSLSRDQMITLALDGA